MKWIALLLLVGAAYPAVAASANVIKRGTLENARIQFVNQKKGHVAFIGGSITEMDGYRPMVCEMLRKKFPATEFNFTAAGIASTCSTTGAFRLKTDVLDQGPVDLLFVEFAVNDDQDAHHTRAASSRGMEGIVRQLRRHNPNADMVITYFVNENSMASYRKGETPLPVVAHEEVAKHYQISTSHLAREVTTRIDAGEFDWKKFGGVHPAPFGNRIAADMIGQLLDECWAAAPAAGAAAKPYAMPAKPLDEAHYGGGRFLELNAATLSEQWKTGIPDWGKIPGSKRDRFTKIPILEADKPGASLTVEFNGSAVGAYVVAGPDAGTVEVSIDGGAVSTVNLFHGFSAGLHYPRTVLFADALPPGKHTLALKISEEKDPRSKGNAMRAVQLVVNEPKLPPN